MPLLKQHLLELSPPVTFFKLSKIKHPDFSLTFIVIFAMLAPQPRQRQKPCKGLFQANLVPLQQKTDFFLSTSFSPPNPSPPLLPRLPPPPPRRLSPFTVVGPWSMLDNECKCWRELFEETLFIKETGSMYWHEMLRKSTVVAFSALVCFINDPEKWIRSISAASCVVF